MDEYVYYFKPAPDQLEDIALIRNREISESELKTLQAAIQANGGAYTRMVKYSGYQMPDFAGTVNL